MRCSGRTTRMLLEALQIITSVEDPPRVLWLVAHTEYYAETLLRQLTAIAKAANLPVTNPKKGAVTILNTTVRSIGELRFENSYFKCGLHPDERRYLKDHACYLAYT